MFDKDNKFGFINNNNENNNNIKDTDLPHTVSSKVLVTVPASDITLQKAININNVSINKDRRYYIEFLGSKKLCSVMVNKEISNSIVCSIDGYVIQVFNEATDLTIFITNTNTDDTPISTDLVIYEEEVKYLDSKYLETDLVVQNSISMGRTGDIGMASVAIGVGVEASGNGSFAEGGGTKASNNSAHAEGMNTIASGESSHAEGNNTKASGNHSHAEGLNTAASGYGSHAEGSTTTASGVNSHAEGDYTTASGASSHAEGYGSKASSQFQHVQGKYNIEDKNRKYAHIVGNGAGDAKRSNAHTLDWKGNGWYAGKLSQEGTPTEDKDLTTKKYVDDNRDYYFKVPTILYDDPNLPKGYVDITTLEKGTNYRVNSSIVSGLFKVGLKAPNDDGTWFTVDDGSNTIGWSSMLSTSICVQLKSDTFIGINMSCVNNYCKYLSITKENGKWKIMQTKLNSISPDNMYEYDVVNDYNPTHKKYVDDKISSLPQLSFNESGELVVTINGVSKTFVPKE